MVSLSNLPFLFFLWYIWMVPLEYLQEKIPKGPTGIHYLNIMMLIMLCWWLFARPGRREGHGVTRNWLNLLLPAFIAYTFVGMLLGSMNHAEIPSPFEFGGLTLTRFLGLLNAALLFWLAANMIDTRKKIRWTIYAIALSSPVVFRAFRNDLAWVSGWHYDSDMRVRGPFVNIGSNELGAYFVYCALFLLLLGFQFRTRWQRLLLWGAGSLYCYGILYCYSRASQLAFVIALALAACLRHWWLLIGFALAFFTMDLWVPVSVKDRWEMTTDEYGQLEKSAFSRKEFWAYARTLFYESPLIGHGVGSFKVLNPAKMDTHNIYYRILAEQGGVGILIFMSLWGAILWMAAELWLRAADPFDRYYGFCLMIATIGLMIVNYFGDRFTHLPMIGHYWVFAGIGARIYSHSKGWEPLADHETGAEVSSVPDVKGAPTPALSLVARSSLTDGPAAMPSPSSAAPPSPASRPLNIVGLPAQARAAAAARTECNPRVLRAAPRRRP